MHLVVRYLHVSTVAVERRHVDVSGRQTDRQTDNPYDKPNRDCVARLGGKPSSTRNWIRKAFDRERKCAENYNKWQNKIRFFLKLQSAFW